MKTVYTHLRDFLVDQGGASLPGFAVVFGTVAMGLLATAAIYLLVGVKSVMSTGVYDAVQYLTYYGDTYSAQDWNDGKPQRDARNIILDRMQVGNLLYTYDTSVDAVQVDVTRPPLLCADAEDGLESPNQLRFFVSANLTVRVSDQIPYFLKWGEFTLNEQAHGFLDCPRGWLTDAPKEEKIFRGRWP